MYHQRTTFPSTNSLNELVESQAFGPSADQLDRLAHEDTPAGFRTAPSIAARRDVSNRIRQR